MKIRSNEIAKKWNHGHPLGNGHMGGMVIDSLPVSCIELTENTFFSGEKSLDNNKKHAANAFYEMREQAKQGNYDEIHTIAEKFIGVRKNFGTNLPVGKLFIDYGIEFDKVTSYERSLNIMEGISSCNFMRGNVRIEEEVLISHPDNIMVCHITLSEDKNIKFSFQPSNAFGAVEYGDCDIKYTCYAYEKLHCDSLCGVMLTGYAKVVTDGICIADEEGLTICNARNIYLYLHMSTNFRRTFKYKELEKTVLHQEARIHVLECIKTNYKIIRNRHEQDIKSFMSKVNFQLFTKDSFIEKVPLIFQYGRYLLLCSSREDSLLPAHLQGIWNDNVACRIGWSCDMHLDINTQMNYWPAQVTNIEETTFPLFRWIRDELAKSGENTARESYGLSGWVGELVSNAWGYAAPYWASPIAPCPTGGVWILMQMWEHYQYTENEDFLRDVAFPLIWSAVEFFVQYIFMEEGSKWYTSGPSISPENSFLYKNKSYQISNGCTYEIVMIRELFQIYLTSCKILKYDGKELYTQVADKLSKLLPYRIMGDGTLSEWSHDLPPSDTQHRHTSHLLGLYPFSQITLENNSNLCEAAKKTIQNKLSPMENWEDTGWARSMLILYEARLCNGNEAYQHIKDMLLNLLEANYMIYHPPTRGADAFDHVYELDGNTGLTTGIAEMLIQSHDGVIKLLPALPDSWNEGKVTGLCARGNITVDLFWEKGKLKEAYFLANKNKTCTICYQGKIKVLPLLKDVKYLVTM